jgi:hypothetical protein
MGRQVVVESNIIVVHWDLRFASQSGEAGRATPIAAPRALTLDFTKSVRAATQYQLDAYRANFHSNKARIIAEVSARRESLHLFDDLMTQLKSRQFTAPTYSF